MQQTSVLTSVESERKELEDVVACLERTPRLAKLLRYLAEKYFAGESDQLTEYNIATEVFGRKKTDFVASEDAIARVEAHRLRKKLKTFYQAEGKDHPVQISIPLGTYVPVFSPQDVESHSAFEPVRSFASNGELLSEAKETVPGMPEQGVYAASSFRPMRGIRLYVLIATVVVVSVFGAYKLFRSRNAATSSSAVQNSAQSQPSAEITQPQDPPTSGTIQLSPVTLPFRMIAGYAGPPQRDSAGEVWQADQYFHEGWALHQPAVFIPRTSDPIIFRYGRAGDFSYDIPLKQGLYELHLYFFQPSDTNQSEDAENKSIFTVTINGDVALQSFDVASDAMGRNIADERILRDVSPARDGILHVRLNTVLGTPSLSAIQVLDGTPHKQLPIRVVTQSTSFTDHDGKLWHPDNYFLSGRHLSHNIPVTGSSDPDLLSSERYGHFSYAFPVDPRDRYTVVLHFVELYFGTEGPAEGGSGSRVFRVMCNGNTLLDNFDIYKEAGSFHTLKKTFYHLKPTAQGKLNLTFEPISNYATISAIEVLDESN